MPFEPAPSRRARRRNGAGFSFLELLVVMGVLAVLLGLGIGFLTNVGRAAQSAQAAAIVVESAFRCQNQSAGAKTATLEIRKEPDAEGDERYVVVTSVQHAVLTANFEAARKKSPETEGLVNAGGSIETYSVSGSVTADEDGAAGRAVAVGAGGIVDFGRRASFAVTHGLEVDAWVKPAPGRARMTLLRGEGDGGEVLWHVTLSKAQVGAGPESYGVEVGTRTVDERSDRGTGATLDLFRTKDPCLPAGKWSHLHVAFDGREVAVTVDGVRRPPAEVRAKGAPSPTAKRFVLPDSGAAKITLSAGNAPFAGSVDTLTVGGIFRTDDDVRELRGDVVVEARTLPVLVRFANGRLDSTYHSGDQEIYLASPKDLESGTRWRVRIGLYGSIQPAEKVPTAPKDAASR